MNDEMRNVLKYILDNHGTDIFSNMNRINAILLDLAADMPRERILVRSFVEADGFRTLKNAGETYPVVASRLINTLTDMFSMEREAAAWVTKLCASALGYDVADFYLTGYTEEKVTVTPSAGSIVALGMAHIIAAATDGTVFHHGMNDHFQTDVSGWRRITAVAAGVSHTVGLKNDGTVLATGLNIHDQCDVGFWNGVTGVYAFGHETIGIRGDGTVISAGRSRFNLAHFEGIKKIAKAPLGIYGINGENKVTYSDLQADEDTGKELEWLNSLPGVKDIISRANETVALCMDGRLYKFGEYSGYFSQWRDVISAVDLNDGFAILRNDGTVRVLPFDREKARVSTRSDLWTDITAIYGNYGRIIAQTADGHLRATYTSAAQARNLGSFDYLTGWYPVGV